MKKTIVLFGFFFAVLAAHAQTWLLKDLGVGLVVQDERYDTILNVAQKGKSWNMNKLYAQGAFAGKYKGNQAFAAWLQGPPADQITNANGLPVWLYKYKITYPDGSTFEAGPYGFYTPGFAVVTLDYGKKGPKKYRIDFFIWNRDTKETRHVGAAEFTAVYDEKDETAEDILP